MLDWSAGPLRAADALSAPINEGVSCIDEPPETPAHVFALRAFKTALFGTPRPEERLPPSEPVQQHIKNAVNCPRSTARADVKEVEHSPTPIRATEPRASTLVPVGSPSKGILLTPGIGTSRRKNVSFMHIEPQDGNLTSPEPQEPCLSSQDDSPTRRTHRRDKRSRPTTFTQTLIELSKQKEISVASATPKLSLPPAPKPWRPIDEAVQADLDHTVDLSQPRSQSGQHWKCEYEAYFQRSDQEMKKVIQYGQNIKSFAVKRDCEAAELALQLERGQEQIRALERKVARLTDKLGVAQASDPKKEGHQARLIAELAQQTALAKQYAAKLEKMQDSQREPAPQELLELRGSAKDAQSRAAKLEAENDALKAQLARVKQKMMSYEPRRQAREEKLRRRGENYKTAKEAAETRLLHAQLGSQRSGGIENAETGAMDVKNPPLSTHNDEEEEAAEQTRPVVSTSGDDMASKRMSPRKRRGVKAPVDIWTSNSPPEQQKPATSEAGLLPSSVKQDIDLALKEIDLNLRTHAVPLGREKPSKKEPIGYEDGKPVWPDTSPTALGLSIGLVPLSSPAKLQASSGRSPRVAGSLSHATIGRSASMLSRAGGTVGRTTSLASARSASVLTADRAASARDRLAKRSAGKARARART